MEVDPSVPSVPESPTSTRRHVPHGSLHVDHHTPVDRWTSIPRRVIDIAPTNDATTSLTSTTPSRHGFLRSLSAPMSYFFPMNPTFSNVAIAATPVSPTIQLHRDNEVFDHDERATLLRNINADVDYEATEPGVPQHSFHVGMSASLPSPIRAVGADAPADTTPEPPVADDSEEQLRTELRRLFGRVHHIVPFAVLLVLYFAYVHIIGIFIFVLGCTSIIALDQRFRAQVAMKDKASTSALSGIFLVSAVDAFALSALNGDLTPLHTLCKAVADPSSLADVVWTVMINDLILRLASFMAKIVVALVQVNGCCRYVKPATHHRRKRKMYAAIEHLSLLVRSCCAAFPWYAFYSAAESKHVANLFQGIYSMFKIYFGVGQSKKVAACILAAVTLHVEYGTYVSSTDLAEMCTPDCSICYDTMQTPVQLQCAHLFCEECIAEWFDRERSCPLCRADVHASDATSPATKPMYLDGSTSPFPQFL
ncbi:hypothetical protein H310_01980 [Aphanomyces invadans]|uniref:RING-type domain-containing protein n=1 Tax=Aphanomyces invadans TaxID=157072 RepID=A0A024UMT2_9STRA|nr:hypothetical protein H310_01980 [Aphanomyces invadans]ETW07470.1 hypothetical protein H310_01980 [Aphanomyces invadans]|eukprot:XP_008863563.1 hypothetical protein H310_01980 [Aphanomyces invadans]